MNGSEGCQISAAELIETLETASRVLGGQSEHPRGPLTGEDGASDLQRLAELADGLRRFAESSHGATVGFELVGILGEGTDRREVVLDVHRMSLLRLLEWSGALAVVAEMIRAGFYGQVDADDLATAELLRGAATRVLAFLERRRSPVQSGLAPRY